MSVLIDYSSGAFEANKAQGVGTITANDTNFADVSLLLHGDGTSGSTTITDSSSNSVSLTVTGNTQIDTAVKKFGTGSIQFDGAGDYLTTSTNSAFGYGAGDFTIEFFLYLNSVSSSQTICSNLTSASSTNPHIYLQSGGTIRYYTASASRITSAVLSAGQFYHVAVAKSGSSTKLFINGSQSGSTYSDNNDYGASAPLGVGTYWSGGSPTATSTLNGFIDELRITKGVARYTSNFTPPTAAFLNSGPTLDLSSGTYFNYAPSANTTFAFANPPASGTAAGFALAVTPSATVALTYPASVKWPSGTAPDAPAINETDVLVFLTDDGGTSYQGFQAGGAMA